MKPVNELTDDELKAELTKFGFNAGPVTGTTRNVLQKKLNSFRNGSNTISKPTKKPAVKATPSSILPPPPVFDEDYEDDHMEKLSTFQSSSISISKLPKKPAAKATPSPILPSGFDEDYEDDHMESSRILSPRSRLYPANSSSGGRLSFGNYSGSYGGEASARIYPKKESPLNRFTDFGRTAWGFFSRPIGTSTPCSEVGQKYTGYATSTANKYRRSNYLKDDYGRKGGLMPVLSSDTSRWIGLFFIGFLSMIFAGYIYQAHTDTVQNALVTSKDMIVLISIFLYDYAIVPVFIFLFAALLVIFMYKMLLYFREQKAEEKRRLIELVEQITDIIYQSGNAGVAEPHVRDMLLPPTKRTKSEYKRWQEAARFINNEDSRIRTEIRLIDGIECNVWIWSGAGKQRWQGTAVAEGSPMAKVPEQALTRCLKLRGFNFSKNVLEQENIRQELLDKLEPIKPIHVGFNNNMEDAVYIMLKNHEDSKRAFSAFHSHWFNGNLITVKYVRDERYQERFPEVGK